MKKKKYIKKMKKNEIILCSNVSEMTIVLYNYISYILKFIFIAFIREMLTKYDNL